MTGKILNNPGIMQVLGLIWPTTRELDICLPGPDMGWQDRTLKELERNSAKLQEKSTDDDPKEAAEARLVFRELQFAVDFFKDWINNKMMAGNLALESSILYMDAISELETAYQQSDELVAAKRTKTSALARLQAIKISLDGITTQPAPGSGGELTLINLKKQYNVIGVSASNTATIEERRSELDIAKDKFENLKKLVKKCATERVAKGWAVPGGKDSVSPEHTWSDGTKVRLGEQAAFCDFPVKGGYNHETFDHKNDETGHGLFGGIIGQVALGPVGAVAGGIAGSLTGASVGKVTYNDVPYVNAKKVFTFDKALGSGDTDIEMNCNYIYKANVLDYKGTIPGLTTVSEVSGVNSSTNNTSTNTSKDAPGTNWGSSNNPGPLGVTSPYYIFPGSVVPSKIPFLGTVLPSIPVGSTPATVGSHTACKLELVGQGFELVSGPGQSPSWAGRQESLHMCGNCLTTAVATCNEMPYRNCTITSIPTTYQACP